MFVRVCAVVFVQRGVVSRGVVLRDVVMRGVALRDVATHGAWRNTLQMVLFSCAHARSS